MSGNPHHALRRSGEALARELAAYVEREYADKAEAAQVLLGASEYLERRTLTVRGRDPWPANAGPSTASSN